MIKKLKNGRRWNTRREVGDNTRRHYEISSRGNFRDHYTKEYPEKIELFHSPDGYINVNFCVNNKCIKRRRGLKFYQQSW
jgi:hypothetical protein